MQGDGGVEKKELVVHGRKVSIMDIRKDLLAKHERMGLMRDHDMTLGEYFSMQRKEIVKELKAMDEYQEDNDCTLEDGQLAGRLYACHNTRMLLLGHDHAEVLGHSYLMEVVQVVYDKALFWTDEEYAKKHGQKLSVQKAVENANCSPPGHVRGLRRGAATDGSRQGIGHPLLQRAYTSSYRRTNTG